MLSTQGPKCPEANQTDHEILSSCCKGCQRCYIAKPVYFLVTQNNYAWDIQAPNITPNFFINDNIHVIVLCELNIHKSTVKVCCTIGYTLTIFRSIAHLNILISLHLLSILRSAKFLYWNI